jgi:hypothetical protein
MVEWFEGIMVQWFKKSDLYSYGMLYALRREYLDFPNYIDPTTLYILWQFVANEVVGS